MPTRWERFFKIRFATCKGSERSGESRSLKKRRGPAKRRGSSAFLSKSGKQCLADENGMANGGTDVEDGEAATRGITAAFMSGHVEKRPMGFHGMLLGRFLDKTFT